ncbi:UPF0145 protein [Streptomyces vinaceus]|nr:UPF0145 protein [Streptomyces vinaceus]
MRVPAPAARVVAMGIEDYSGGPGAQQTGVLVVTTNDVPGYRVERVIGEVFGLTVRSRHLGSQIGAGLKSMIGGELKGLTKTLVETRNQAMERLIEASKARGGNAVLMMRFDVTEAADVGTEVCAYGTAVVITPAAS